jgi:imidazolonepropionase-like amidohydrolase
LPSTQPEISYKAAWLLDGTGGPPLRNAVLTIRDGIIAGVDSAGSGVRTKNVVDLGVATLLPGLIDAHVHLVWNAGRIPHEEVALDATPTRTVLRMAQRAERMLASGITTARDLGATDSLTLPLAEAIEAGEIAGPELLAAGRAIAMTGGHAWQITSEADGPDAIRRAVREEIKRGARTIKLMASGGVYDKTAKLDEPQLSLEELRAGVEAAHQAGLMVAAHAYTPGPINLALDAGVDTIEHGSFIDEPTALRMRQERRFFVPTMMASHLIVQQAEMLGTPVYMRKKGLVVRDAVREGVRTALRLGTPIAGGSDSGGAGIEHGNLALEARLFTEVGASPSQAVAICTSGSAAALGLAADRGVLQPGMRADFMAVAGDLGADINALKDVRLVAKAGIPCRGH